MWLILKLDPLVTEWVGFTSKTHYGPLESESRMVESTWEGLLELFILYKFLVEGQEKVDE